MNPAGGPLIILKKDKPRLGNNKQHTKKKNWKNNNNNLGRCIGTSTHADLKFNRKITLDGRNGIST
jgi:hypothetical protein